MPSIFRRFVVRAVIAIPLAAAGCLPDSPPNSALPKKGPIDPPVNPPAAPAASNPKGPHQGDPVRLRIEAAIAQVRGRELLTTNSFWTVLHGIVGMGPTAMLKDPETGRQYNAVDYIFSEAGANIRGLAFVPTQFGVDVPFVGTNPFLKEHEGQGHQDQFLAEMIEVGLPATRPVKILGFPNRSFTLQDFVSESKARARIDQNQELSWLLIVVAEDGGGTEATWTNRLGQRLRFEDVLDYEMKQDINASSCGGTHRLFGIAWAYHRHLERCRKEKREPSAIWKRAGEYLEKYKDLSREWQAPTGEFSTAHYRQKEWNPDVEARLAASGHIFEWLAEYVTDDEIRSAWMEKGAAAVAQIILDSDRSPLASGGLYHACHGLLLYHARRYGTADAAFAHAGH